MRLVVVPAAHISRKSARNARRAVENEKPDIVAVELCRARLAALLGNTAPRPRQLLASPFFGALFLLQQLLGLIFRTRPGEEMLAAVKTAAERGTPVVLVDQPITKTLARLARVPVSEKIRLFLHVSFSPLLLLAKRRFSLAALTSQEFLAPVLLELKQNFPHTYAALIAERDAHMARRLAAFPGRRIVLVVGAGHVGGIRRRLAAILKARGEKLDIVVL